MLHVYVVVTFQRIVTITSVPRLLGLFTLVYVHFNGSLLTVERGQQVGEANKRCQLRLILLLHYEYSVVLFENEGPETTITVPLILSDD